MFCLLKGHLLRETLSRVTHRRVKINNRVYVSDGVHYCEITSKGVYPYNKRMTEIIEASKDYHNAKKYLHKFLKKR